MMRNNWDNCRLELENREFLSGLEETPSDMFQYSRPEYVPIDWHKTESQGPIGSCRGHSGTSCAERLQFAKYRDKSKVVQLSEIFFYLATQKIDGLLGRDVGSTISGGAKLMMQTGCCPESNTGYPRNYPSRSARNSILSSANYNAAKEYKAVSKWRVPDDVDACMDFIGSRGAIDYGVAYWSGMIPRDRIVRTFRPPSRGTKGHAMCALGYTRDGNILAVNSHNDGPYQWEPKAWREMIRHPRTAAVGYLGQEEPEPFNWRDWI